MKSRSFLRLFCLSLLALPGLMMSDADGAHVKGRLATQQHQIVYVRAGVYRPGSSQEELIYAAMLCRKEGGGTDCSPESYAEELSDWNPISVKSFHIDRYEVTIGDYETCRNRGLCRSKIKAQGPEDQPVTQISFDEARQYCIAHGGDLPSELQFEFAASSAGKNRYPWGDAPQVVRTNWGQRGAGQYRTTDGYRMAASARSLTYDRTPTGIIYLAGNVAEWTLLSASWRREKGTNVRPVIRGGHFRSPASEGRNFCRTPTRRSRREHYLGFRCVY